MKNNPLFPRLKERYTGPRSSFWFLVLVTIIETVRSFIHVLSPDGGAQSIAGIDVHVAGGANIIALFAQWGAMQLLLAILYWLVILRYQVFTPLMILFVALEQILRMGVGHLKPLVVASPPPGATGSEVLLPVSLLALLWSVKSGLEAFFSGSDATAE